MTNIIFIINSIAPIFLIIIVGWALRKFGVISQTFIKQAIKFVFNVTLPLLIFLKIANTKFSSTLDMKLVFLVIISILIVFIIGWVLARLFINKGEGRGVFIQGSFWPNNVILGLALIDNLFGESAVVKALILLTFLIPIYNFLSVFALSISDKTNVHGKGLVNILKLIFINPVIIAAFLGIVLSTFGFTMPKILSETGSYLAAITLPLALIAVGGTLRIKLLQSTSALTISATLIKLILAPIIAISVAIFFGYRGVDLAVIFVIFACPTAIVSFVMAESMTPHGEIAGNIVLMTTLLSAITIAAGLMILTYFGLL